jgi:hypothetical protein
MDKNHKNLKAYIALILPKKGKNSTFKNQEIQRLTETDKRIEG